MGVEVARLFAADKLILKGEQEENSKTIVFTEDNVHPLAESGHPIYAYVVTKYLDKLQKKKCTFSYNLRQP